MEAQIGLAGESLSRVVTSLRDVSESLEQIGAARPEGTERGLPTRLAALQAARSARSECDLLVAYLLELAGEAGGSSADLGWDG